MVNRDIVVAKIANIQKSIDRLKEKGAIEFKAFSKDRDTQDIVLLNLQTAIQGCIDIASHIISDNNWGIPGSLAGLFDTLCEKKVISEETRKIMRSMTGFRNLIVHEYARLETAKVYEIYTGRLSDFNLFLKQINGYLKL